MGEGEQNRRDSGVYTPSLLWSCFRENVPKPSLRLIAVEGIFKGFNSDKEYAGKRYGTLIDANDGRTTVALRIPKALVPEFMKQEGRLYVLRGVPYWDIKPDFGRAEIVLDVKEIEGIEACRPDLSVKAELLNRKAERGWRDIESVLREKLRQGIKPKVVMVVGETAIVQDDVLRALGASAKYYRLEQRRASFLDEGTLSHVLLSLDEGGYDLIALVRGGGSGLEIFNSTSLAETVLKMKTPLATALGHAQNLHFLDMIADKHFITPTAFGKFLHEVASAIDETSRLRAKLEEMERELHLLREENSSLLKRGILRERIYLAVVLVLLFLLAFLLLR